MSNNEDKVVVPSKKSVTKAGITLCEESGLSEKVINALDIMNDWRGLHAYPIDTFQRNLKNRCKALGIKKFTVAQRLKRLPSIIHKLQRNKGQMQLARMQDIGGIRVILPDVVAVSRLNGALTSANNRVSLRPMLKYQDYVQTPKEDGYRSLHRVYEYKSRKRPELNGLKVELQLRTELQHSWATAIEVIDILEQTSLKNDLSSLSGFLKSNNDGGNENKTVMKYKRFFLLTSALFADKEKSVLPPGFDGMTMRDIAEEAKLLEKECNIMNRLKSASITSRNIEYMTKKKQGYHILALLNDDTEAWKLQVYSFDKDDILSAKQLYASLEQKEEYGDVVLISVGDLHKIKTAYPNYFLNAEMFIKEFKVAIKKHLAKAEE